MTKEDLRNTKIYLCCPEGRRKFQEHCFRLGIRWASGDKKVIYLDEECYWINDHFKLRCGTFDSFISQSQTQVSLKDVLSIPIPKKEYEFELFERVLVRDTVGEIWSGGIFSHKRGGELFPYVIAGGFSFTYCIPYKGNEHLLGTTKDVE